MNAKRRHRRRRRRDRQRAIELARWEPSWRAIDWSDVELTIDGDPFASGKATVRTGVYTIECVMEPRSAVSTTCRSCGAAIIWVEVESGKRMPLDPPEKRVVIVPSTGKGRAVSRCPSSLRESEVVT